MNEEHQDQPSTGNSINLLHEQPRSERLIQFTQHEAKPGVRGSSNTQYQRNLDDEIRWWETRWRDTSPIDASRETMRGRLALLSIGLLFFLVGAPIIAVFVSVVVSGTVAEDVSTPIRDLLSILLPPVSGIVGAAIAYYYGTRPDRDPRPPGTTPEVPPRV
jgi:hypothetical protein